MVSGTQTRSIGFDSMPVAADSGYGPAHSLSPFSFGPFGPWNKNIAYCKNFQVSAAVLQAVYSLQHTTELIITVDGAGFDPAVIEYVRNYGMGNKDIFCLVSYAKQQAA